MSLFYIHAEVKQNGETFDIYVKEKGFTVWGVGYIQEKKSNTISANLICFNAFMNKILSDGFELVYFDCKEDFKKYMDWLTFDYEKAI